MMLFQIAKLSELFFFILSDSRLHGGSAPGFSDLLAITPPTLSLFAAGIGGFGRKLRVESGERR